MSLVKGSLTNDQRLILHKLYYVEAQTVEPEYKDITGRVEHTDESKKRYKQLRGFSMAVDTSDGGLIDYEDPAPIHLLTLEPTVVTKGVKFTPQMKYVDQFGLVSGFTGQFAKSFMHKKNQVAANLDNLGFTSTTMGVNSEALYAASHDMGGVTFSNLLTGALSPNTAKAGLIALANQVSAQNEPMPYTKSVLLKTPPDLTPTSVEIIKSLLLANTANNNTNEYLRNRLQHVEIHYYTSTTAWFMRAMENSEHGMVFLEQMPFDVTQLPQSEDTGMWPWFAMESHKVGWYDAHGTLGSTGT